MYRCPLILRKEEQGLRNSLQLASQFSEIESSLLSLDTSHSIGIVSLKEEQIKPQALRSYPGLLKNVAFEKLYQYFHYYQRRLNSL